MGLASTLNESRLSALISRYQLPASVVIYGLVAVVAYGWLEGEVGVAGTVDGSVAAIALVLGSILFVPIIRGLIQQYVGETESARLGLTGTDTKD